MYCLRPGILSVLDPEGHSARDARVSIRYNKTSRLAQHQEYDVFSRSSKDGQDLAAVDFGPYPWIADHIIATYRVLRQRMNPSSYV